MLRWLTITTCLLAAGLACGDGEVIYRDHEVFFDYDPDEVQAGVEKALIPGIYEEQLFRRLEPSDPLHIVAGFQGGIWVHLSLRVTGMRSRGQIEATLHLEDEQPVGATAFSIKLVRTAEGYLEAYDIPIPVGGRGASMEDIDHLFGQTATLTLRYTADDVVVEETAIVVLERG